MAMKIEIISENKCCGSIEDALLELAFCHYPVTIKVLKKVLKFDTFMDVEKYLKEGNNDTE